MPRTYTHRYSLTHIPPGLKRGSLALIAPFDQGEIILATKHVYPENIFRLIGGGVDATDQSPLHAATREFEEEVGLRCKMTDFTHNSTHLYELSETGTGTHFDLTIDLFTISASYDSLQPASDIDAIKQFNRFEFKQLINRYQELPKELVTLKPDNTFRWSDWGYIYNQINLSLYRHWPAKT
jgi:8-oxo-dGTP pyrophosphatase MutT (NUDIX family)